MSNLFDKTFSSFAQYIPIHPNVQTFYLIKWDGFSARHNNWEPTECLINCSGLLAEYLARNEAQEILSKFVWFLVNYIHCKKYNTFFHRCSSC